MRISDWSSDVCSSDLLGVLEVLRGIFRPETLSRPQAVIIWDVRLHYTLMALVVGAALSLAGAELQTILDNPLPSPFTLGVSSAASLGAGPAIVLGMGVPGVPQSWIVPATGLQFARPEEHTSELQSLMRIT